MYEKYPFNCTQRLRIYFIKQRLTFEESFALDSTKKSPVTDEQLVSLLAISHVNLSSLLTLLICISLTLSRWDLSLVLKVTLISNQDDLSFLISMVTHLSEPSIDIIEWHLPWDVIHQENTNCLPIVCTRDGSISVLACCVPNLCSNHMIIKSNSLGDKLHSNCWHRS